MTQVFDDKGKIVPVTVLKAGPCVVTQVKTRESDGYDALQVGFIDQKAQRLNKPQRVEAEKRKVAAKRVVSEIRLDTPSDRKVGDEIKCDVFQVGDLVDVIGHAKGRGFTGVMRAWNFGHKSRSRGCMNMRGPGSIGMRTWPGRVLKGKRMATHWGGERITVKNLRVISVQTATDSLLVKGAVPGTDDGVVFVQLARSVRPFAKSK
ncbi:MAG: 50S ribosomal protein L3 [Planctomycetes bacterium]|nr:50S ribosomal protein L3 [Planctomycetota bacterium]